MITFKKICVTQFVFVYKNFVLFIGVGGKK